MEILSSDNRPTARGRSDYFTGTVWIDPIAAAAPPSRVRALRVSFEPGARTAWHTHPFGQVLHILAGVGRVRREGEPVRTVKAGDTVLIEPGERHWHGAAPTHTMVHLAIHEAGDDGKDAAWFEQVSDEDYGGSA